MLCMIKLARTNRKFVQTEIAELLSTKISCYIQNAIRVIIILLCTREAHEYIDFVEYARYKFYDRYILYIINERCIYLYMCMCTNFNSFCL